MAAESRGTAPPVTASPLDDVLFEEGYRFDFFQAVRVLERLYPDRQPIGRDANPWREAVRFRSHLSLSFPPSAIYEVDRAEDGDGPAQMTVTFMGLTGPLGVLPRHYTELLLERMRHKDEALRDFLDLFNHRLISLFYRAWEKYRFPIAYERAVSKGESEDHFTRHLFDLIGLGTKGLRGRLEVEDEPLLFYVGLLAQHPRSASALEGLLRDYFEVPVTVTQFIGEWLPLSEANRSRLGRGETNHALGVSAVAGNRVWDQQARFRLQLGPLTFSDFCRFLPSGDGFLTLTAITRFSAGEECDFDVQLILKAAEVPWCRLGGTDEQGMRLGWSTWLKCREFASDAGDAIFAGRQSRTGGSSGASAGARQRGAS
jgi:type VI secretion system protein ImpH